jgi:hypothetical protein
MARYRLRPGEEEKNFYGKNGAKSISASTKKSIAVGAFADGIRFFIVSAAEIMPGQR